MNPILVERQGPIAVVKLNRPDKYNAMSIEMFDSLINASEELATDSTVRAIVMTGEGKVFCSGMDVANFNPDSPITVNLSLIHI